MINRARIINIMDEKNILIDYGFVDGATEGQKVRVLEKGTTVYDLNNKELGSLDSIKDVLEIVRVYERFSVCQKLRRTSAISSLSQLDLVRTSVEPIRVDSGDISNLSYPEKKPIKKGDQVEIFTL